MSSSGISLQNHINLCSSSLNTTHTHQPYTMLNPQPQESSCSENFEDLGCEQFICLLTIVRKAELEQSDSQDIKRQAIKTAITLYKDNMSLGTNFANSKLHSLILQSICNPHSSESITLTPFENALELYLHQLNIEDNLNSIQRNYYRMLINLTDDIDACNVVLEEEIISQILKHDSFYTLVNELGTLYTKLIHTNANGHETKEIVKTISQTLNKFYQIEYRNKEYAEQVFWKKVLNVVCNIFSTDQKFRKQFIIDIEAEDSTVIELWMTDEKFLTEDSDVRQRIWDLFLARISADPKRDKELSYIYNALVCEARTLIAAREVRLHTTT